MALTAKQIADLNSSMEAARLANLGTHLGNMVENQVRSGSIVPTSAREVVVTGLTSVTEVAGSLSGSPTLEHAWAVVTSGSVAGTLIIESYKPTAAGNVLPIASTGSWVAVNWIAVGE